METSNKLAEHTLDLFGMTCANCALRIEKGLSKVAGVSDVRVNFARESVFLRSEESVTVDSLLKTVEFLGYSATEHDPNKQSETEKKQKDHIRVLKIRFILSALFSLPLFYGMVTHFQFLSFLPMPHILMDRWVQLVLATPVQFIIGFPFYQSAYRALRNGSANMDVLVVIGTSAAYGYSIFGKDLYFETSSVLITFILGGKWIEHVAKGKSSDGIKALLTLRPETATVKTNGVWTEVPNEYLKQGDLVLVKALERFPMDGIVTEGESYADESMLTGESMPVEKKQGDKILGGTVNGNGSLVVKAMKVGNDTTLSHIIRSVEESLGTKAPLQRIADQISAYFVPVVIAISILDFLVWFFLLAPGEITTAIETSIAILVIACPCALGLATPISLLVGTGRAAKRGVLFRSAEALESVSKINLIFFDKTGTLTEGKPKVTDVLVTGISDEKKSIVFGHVLAMEETSDHPLAKAILAFGKEKDFYLGSVGMVKTITSPGGGIQTELDGTVYFAGKQSFVEMNGFTIPETIRSAVEGWIKDGVSLVFVGIRGNMEGMIVFRIEDQIRESSVKAIQELRSIGVEPILLTGDNLEAANKVAKAVGIVSVYSGLLPEEKSKIIKQLKNNQIHSAMVGDGINDAPALASADVGIAMGGGSDIAISTADVVLVNGDIQRIVDLIRIGKDTVLNIRQNFGWALGYNLLGIPIAASGLLAPWVSGAAMAFSSISVVFNALRMSRWK
ncbi:Cation transport ATPase, possibly copper [Leptospira biflexa serovar Patoc strain 'Patoc 1 (Ames)']|uniref:Putative heavy-metal transporting ATPase putative copper-transporting P-type ATPase CopA n=1 Tax=Leptospira biflexa serovar Patoc (strain Patoc 1 / ATCC 23582 / Paris) TaxID=456481 RepID=B0SMU2_LEPBP|nr:heavy metal translocating P-type ATPase [Leptospira biflexa]ABZ95136.1 Cation transport ATPase, possibly copper [Leptospira biflexa serovar Patoc strain 'Patoc 1 (Ames)']ABZ98816.1 Putative heavy-metal transporting ATPase; putative copper-transporting P-type ATPase CopA [Leptospira biflexa serovar Patoc strain 'Patoc 1 (Paris)']